jgi:hypothetical protein
MPVRIPEVCLAEYCGRLTFLFTHGDAIQWPLFIEASRGTGRTSSVCGDAPENDLIEDVGACPCNPFRPLDRIHH